MNSKTIAWLWRIRRMSFWHASHMKLWSTKKIELVLLQIRRIYSWRTAHLYQNFTRWRIQDYNIYAASKIKIRRISRRCTNIPEYINLGPHAKLSQCRIYHLHVPHRPLEQKLSIPKAYTTLKDLLPNPKVDNSCRRVPRHAQKKILRAVRRSYMYLIH